MDQRIDPWQLYFLGGVLLLPVVLVGGALVFEKIAFDRDMALITERKIDELTKRLRDAEGSDRLLQSYSLTLSFMGPPNALGAAAARCDEEVVALFFEFAGEKLHAEYVRDAEAYFELQPAARQCPKVGELLRRHVGTKR